MTTSFKRFYFTTAILVVFAMVYSQPKEDLFRLQQKYPDQSAAFTNVAEQVNIQVVNGKFNIKMSVEKESMLLDGQAALFANGEISYSSLFFLSNVEAATLYPGEKRYKEIKVEEFKEKDRMSNSIFYDDVKEKSFTYPSLVKGAKRYLKLQYDLKDPYLLSTFTPQENVPVENATLKIICPAGMQIGYKVFNGDSMDWAFEEKKEKDKTIYTWRVKNLKQAITEGSGPGYLYYAPHITYYIKNYTDNGKKQKIIESVDDLHAYYSGLVKGVNDEKYAPLKKQVDSLIKDVSTDEQKVKNIFYWVKDNIKYIAFESGYEGFIPASAKDVYEKRFGDCKGMASILTAMLGYANIKAYLTWIGTRSLPYKYADNPTSGSDNHMIASLKLNGNYLFLDATSTTTPFGYPTGFIQGKEAIVHLSDDKFEIVTVPEVPADLNENADSVVVEITKDMKLAGVGYSSCSGFERDELLNRLDDHTANEKLNILKGYFQKGNNKFILESFLEKNADDRDLPFKIDYRFNVSDYVLQSGNEIFVNMNLEKPYSKFDVEKDRQTDVEFDYKKRLRNTVVVKIPEGYDVAYLPANDSLNTKNYAFNISYQKKDGAVILTANIWLKCLMLEKKDFGAWNDFIARLRKNYTESVGFVKK